MRSRTDRGGRIRTGDLLLPKQARYRTTLRPARTPRITGAGGLVNGCRSTTRVLQSNERVLQCVDECRERTSAVAHA